MEITSVKTSGYHTNNLESFIVSAILLFFMDSEDILFYIYTVIVYFVIVYLEYYFTEILCKNLHV